MKNRLNIILFVLLAGMAGALYFLMGSPEAEKFAVEDTDSIDRIEMEKLLKGKSAGKIVLEKNAEGIWMVNGAYTAIQPRVENLLRVMGQLYEKEELTDKAKESAMTLIKQTHTHVSIWANGSNIRRYYIGPTNNLTTANVMLMEGSDSPVMVALPAQNGYVGVYFMVNENEWRERLLFDLHKESIAEVSVSYLENDEDFVLKRQAQESPWFLGDGLEADAGHARLYFEQFEGKVFAESFADQAFPGMRDSLSRRAPDVRFHYRTFAGDTGSVVLFTRPENLNNYFGWVPGKSDFYTIQRHIFDKFLKSRDWFRKDTAAGPDA